MFETGMIIQNRYEIIEEVGSGGMSVVYKAKCHVLNRFVAIKVLKPEFSDDTTFVNKFRIEAQSAAALSHPNIVNVFDVGEENGFYYIVMELVEGITLKEYIQQNGRLPYPTALDFIMQITSGIQVAHEHHTIHRDIKPQNIIVSKSGTLKVTDFGIAKAATSNTIASSAMGSVHYISPEQARGGYSDERSDIYSLGITLYEMLTGRVPFEGENNVTVALMHIQSEMIPMREYYPDIPVGLEKIVQKATQKKPERRYLTTNALMADLRQISLNPNADVGNISAMHASAAPTIQISNDELSAIQNASRNEPEIMVFPVDSGKQSNNYEQFYQPEESIGDSLINEEFGKEDDGDDDDKDNAVQDLDPKIEKIITIGAIAATVLIAVIIIVVIANMSGMVGKKNKNRDSVTTEIASTTEAKKMIGVVGLKEEEALSKLETEKIEYTIERKYSDKFDKGIVMSQSVKEGNALDEDTTVKIVISKGKEKVKVPSVVGNSRETARETLEDEDFVVEDSQEEYSDTVPSGCVIRQTPEGGSSAEKGSTVTLVISKGEEIKVSVVPYLTDKNITEAESSLNEVNLLLGNVSQEYSDHIEEGKVISQSIASGTEVKEKTTVDITISKGKEPEPTTQSEPSTYSATFSGAINNSGYYFEEGETVQVNMVLRVDGATYTVVSGTYTEVSFPIQLDGISGLSGLTSKNATLVYSVKNENGEDITGSFSSTAQAKIKAE